MHVGRKRLLTHTLKLERERGDDRWVARTLKGLSDANRQAGLRKEEGEEALEILERLGDTVRQAECLDSLAWLFYDDSQLDTAEGAASRSIHLLLGKDEQIWSADPTIFSARYAIPRASGRRPSTISR